MNYWATDVIMHRIPFFFEPNFDARIEALPAALRLQDKSGGEHIDDVPRRYEPVIYGEFLKRKVANNFQGGSKYD